MVDIIVTKEQLNHPDNCLTEEQIIADRLCDAIKLKYKEFSNTHDDDPTNIVVSPAFFKLMKKYLCPLHLDLTGSRLLIINGLFGHLWGAVVWVKKGVDEVECYTQEELHKKYPQFKSENWKVDL